MLAQSNLADWQNTQSAVELFSIETIMLFLFDALQFTKNIKLDNKEQVAKVSEIFENVEKISALEEIFKKILEKTTKMENTMQDLCELLIIRQHLLSSLEKIGDEQLKNNPHLDNLIRQYGQIHKSEVPYDEGLFT